MKINLSPDEYMILCRVADYHGSYPAALAHQWITCQAAEQLTAILAQGRRRDGILGMGRDPIPSQDPRPVRLLEGKRA